MKPFDLQVNGYAGVDFCSLELTGEALHHACQELRDDGVDSILATVITDSIANLETKLTNLVRFREQDDLALDLISGFHIEGPFLSPQPGYAGAHLPELMKPANTDDTKRLLAASNGLTRLVTIAPECAPDSATIDYLVSEGVSVSAGHCDPSLDQLRSAIDAGLSMVTHFGNGCPVNLPRHDNVLQRLLSCREDLQFCFIADGAHVDFPALRNYIDLVGIDHSIMVTDAIAAAKMPVGIHQLSGMEIEVDVNGVARKPGSKNLAGSTITMPLLLKKLSTQMGFSKSEIRQMVESNPRQAVRPV